MPELPEINDVQLIQSAQGGDAQAFGELYDRYATRVFRYLYAHLDNRLDAEDLTEEFNWTAKRSRAFAPIKRALCWMAWMSPFCLTAED